MTRSATRRFLARAPGSREGDSSASASVLGRCRGMVTGVQGDARSRRRVSFRKVAFFLASLGVVSYFRHARVVDAGCRRSSRGGEESALFIAFTSRESVAVSGTRACASHIVTWGVSSKPLALDATGFVGGSHPREARALPGGGADGRVAAYTKLWKKGCFEQPSIGEGERDHEKHSVHGKELSEV